MSFPSTACLVQDRLGIVAPAIEVEAACAGFMHALITAAAYIVAGVSETALVIGADCNSRVLNPDDIKTYPLFGDGAGAVVLTKGRPDQGLVSYSMGSDGFGGEMLCRPSGGSRNPPTSEHLDQVSIACSWTAGQSSNGPWPFSDTIRSSAELTPMTSACTAHQANIPHHQCRAMSHIPRSGLQNWKIRQHVGWFDSGGPGRSVSKVASGSQRTPQ